MPIRIQRKRTPGCRTPLCTCGCGKPAIYVGRPSRWGNCFRVEGRSIIGKTGAELWLLDTEAAAIAHAVRAFRWQILHHPNVTGFTVNDISTALRGHDLSCWCPPGQPCHADVLLELANQGGEQP